MDKIKRVAVKIGSNVLTRQDGTLDITRMSALVDQIAALRKAGIEVVLISSGAVASGRSELHINHKLDSVDSRQLFSAVGQAKLINRYYELFREHHISVGQVLTMKESFGTRRHYLNQRNCMMVMLEHGVLPIVNENDTVSVTELMFTDNDELSGLIASMMDADLLVILSNVDGIYDGNPKDEKSKLLTRVDFNQDLSTYVQIEKSGFGRGGMLTKCNIARKVASEGISVIIANGKRPNILTDIVFHQSEEVPYTLVVAQQGEVSSVKKWIAHSGGFAKGRIYLNAKACQVLQKDKAVSVLPVGIERIEGDFEKDDIITLCSSEGETLGVGRASYGSDEAKSVKGLHGQKPIIHYDYLYLE